MTISVSVGRLINPIITIPLIIVALLGFSIHVHAASSGRPFVVYDNMISIGKPADLTQYGLKRFDILYPSPGEGDPDRIEIQAWAKNTYGKTDHDLLCLDYEQWDSDRRRETQAQIDTSIARYKLALKHARAVRPNVKYGFYSFPPLRDYFVPVNNDAAALQSWYAANDALQPLADAVDVFYPSLYTFENAPEDWVKYATANIQEAKRLAKGKPIYAYLWPLYRDGSPLAGQKIDGEFWRLQLDTLKNLDIDGVVLWEGNFATWNDNDGWWQATIAFLKEQNGGSAEFNQRPLVDVGNDLRITGLGIELNATITDDGLPIANLDYRWYQTAGSGRVTFSQPTAQTTSATFSQPGNYRLYFEADDGDLKGGQYLNISITSEQAIAKFSYDVNQGAIITDEQNSVNGNGVNIARISGHNGQAIALNGSSSFIELEGNSEFDFAANDFTLATWVYINNSDNHHSSFISKGLVGACCAPNGYPGYFMGLRDNSFTFRLEDDALGLNTREIQAAGLAPRDQWVHVVAVKSNQRMELYVDGRQVASEDYPANTPYSVNTQYPLVLGVQKYWSTAAYLDGKMDDTAIFNRALSAAEIAVLAGKEVLAVTSAHETPASGSIQSGVGTVRGWVCDADVIIFEVDNEVSFDVPYKGDRGDTAGVCGDTDNGYSMAINWSGYKSGSHQFAVYADNERTRVIGSGTFQTARISESESFLKGLKFDYTLSDFPGVGKNALIRWSEADQNFIIVEIYNAGGVATLGASEVSVSPAVFSAGSFHETPASGSIQSGIGTVRGWACDADKITFKVDDQDPVRVPYKGGRGDTVGVCGDADNGYSFATNWSLYEPGAHQFTVYAHGDSVQVIGGGAFRTARIDNNQPFLKGLTVEYTVSDFPVTGKNALIRWSEADQNFIIVDVK